MPTMKVVRYDNKQSEVRDFDRVGASKFALDAIDSNLSVFFQRQLEFIESELNFVDYGELKSFKHLPIESRGGDNLWYTWRLFDKVGTWRIGGEDADDVPEVNIMGAELPVPIRWLTGGFKYNIKELQNGRQAAENHPDQPSLQIELQKGKACFEAFQQTVDKIAWFADSASKAYAGLSGVFYNSYIGTVAAAAGVTNSNTHTTWFGSTAGVRVKDPLDILTDLNNLLTSIRVATLDRYAADTILMPIEHYQLLCNTPMSAQYPLITIMKRFREDHPEITMIDTLVNAKHVPAGGQIATATDVILAYKKDPDVCKLALPRQYTMLPIQERGYNYIIPCYATTAGVITKKPKAMAIMTGTSDNATGS
jgi:hypothetical protein